MRQAFYPQVKVKQLGQIMPPVPATWPPLPQSTPKAQWQIPCDQLMEEEKAQAWRQPEMDGGVTAVGPHSRVFCTHGFDQPQVKNIPPKGYIVAAVCYVVRPMIGCCLGLC